MSSTLSTLGKNLTHAHTHRLVKPLRTCALTPVVLDSSEANDLALRLAQQYTQHEDVIVLDQ